MMGSFGKAPVRLYWSGGRRGTINFGDVMSKEIVGILSGREVIYSSPSEADLCAIGSILERASKHSWKRPFRRRLDRLIVWGSGTMFDKPLSWSPLLDIRSVRGPITRRLVGANNQPTLGDPGLLCNLLLKKRDPKTSYSVAIIPHVNDFSNPNVAKLADRFPHGTIIDLSCPDLKKTTEIISKCETVISSSLHGLIAADALSIPRVRIQFSILEGGNHKFVDYDTSVGLDAVKAMDPLLLHRKNYWQFLRTPATTTISGLRRNLITSFSNIGL